MKSAIEPGNIAVITGAGNGIGRSLAVKMAGLGLRVIATDVNEAALEETLSLMSGDRHAARRVDVRKSEELAALAAEVNGDLGPVRLLCNNAGVVGAEGNPMWELPLEDWQRVFSVNVFGILNGISAFVPGMLAHGLPSHVVNTASMTGLTSSSFVPSYVASKHAIVALTDSLRLQLTALGASIFVTALCPGGVSTGIVNNSRILANQPARTEPMPTNDSSADRLTPDAVADSVVQAVIDDHEFVFPSPGSRERIERWVASFSQYL
jgi:NAD(P)-dependent dehydrogenase (short-subunit alcohol dehydrogenase family)